MVPITVDTANRYLFVYTEISTDSKIKRLTQNKGYHKNFQKFLCLGFSGCQTKFFSWALGNPTQN